MSEMHPVKAILLGAAGAVDDAFGPAQAQADNEEVIASPRPGDRLLDEHRVVIALTSPVDGDAEGAT